MESQANARERFGEIRGRRAWAAGSAWQRPRAPRSGAARWEPRAGVPGTRMLCTACLHTGVPDTVLDGSDRVELVAWCLLALPGWVYCAWRHLQRGKVCARCGSDALMRESRAAAARRSGWAVDAGDSRVHSRRAGLAWPRPFGSTRARLRSGSVAVLLIACAGAAWLAGALELAPATPALQTAGASGLLCASWLARLAYQLARPSGVVSECRAWDARGRPLPIEPVWGTGT
jgi:hypothetical protein